MDLETYQELTGTTVEDENVAKVMAQIRRTRVNLETLLGYSLVKSKAGINYYEEKGKVTTDCIFRGTTFNLDNLTLSAPDDVQGAYRLYSYNKADQFFIVDPFTKLYTVKLVFIQAGDEPNGVTHKTFSNSKIRIEKGAEGFSKSIERCKECFCTCACDNCVQLAVEADWMNENCLPEDLQYLWADMVEYYSDESGLITSETLGPHSYKRELAPAPEVMDVNIAVIKKYAGPNGSAHRTIVV